MKPERWAQIKAIFYEAAERPVPERAAFIRSRCGHDESLAMEIESLVGAHDQAGSFIEGLPEDLVLIGQTLAHYRIEEEIGRGGMGVVYRATDTKLGRQVAIKVLPEIFAREPERLARFEREARMLASLNHPNIAAIHGLEESHETHCLVLELVPGESLNKQLASGPLPIEEALAICRQIAEALEAAHDRGIIHRDLKPSNVMVTRERKVKVLDFGLAKAVDANPTDSTITEDATQKGVVLGTAAYMSPEQARGRALDKRTDI